MNYSYFAQNKVEIKTEFIRFLTKFYFSIVMILTLIFFGFNITFYALTALLFLLIILDFLSKKREFLISKFISNFDNNYYKNYAKKSLTMSILAFFTSFVIVKIISYFALIPLESSLILGFLVLGIGNNFSSLILYFKKEQHHLYGTTFEYIILAAVINVVLFVSFGLPLILSLYLALSVQIFLIIPWIDHNLSVVLITSIMYLILFL